MSYEAATLLLAGYLFTYYNTRINEERKAQIERVNEQVATGKLGITLAIGAAALQTRTRAERACVSSSLLPVTACLVRSGSSAILMKQRPVA